MRISQQERQGLYRRIMRFQADQLETSVFAVAIHKPRVIARGRDPWQTAWQFAIQRLNRFCQDLDERVLVRFDEGFGLRAQRMIRQMRRYHQVPSRFGTGPLRFETTRIIEDPNSRNSAQSFLIQMADWNALAAHRSRHIDPRGRAPDDLWDELGPRRLFEVNGLTGGPPGIVVWPRA